MKILFCGDFVPGGVLHYQDRCVDSVLSDYIADFDLRICTLECAMSSKIPLVSYYIGYKLWRQLLDILPVILVSLLSFGISYIISDLFETSMYIDAGIKLVIFAATYLLCSVLFKMESYQICKGLNSPNWLKFKSKWIKV